MIVATAGHIDHGKTALVRALTGVETDRLPEERRRGISIDLGFAYWDCGDNHMVTFVDTPGHERFVRNMLAGVGGADFALLVVAADDGVMPQTKEHAEILDLAGVRQGLVAISKCDRAPRGRIDEVRRQVRALLASTELAQARMFEVSSVSGEGVREIGEALRNAALQQRAPAIRGEHFRLAVDRAFSISGAGTIVTGTIVAGIIQPGARLLLSPQGLDARVRALQVAGKDVAEARAGGRCAVNLAGIEVRQVARGDWLLAREMHAPTARFEARLRVLHSSPTPLKHHMPVHLHLGTADFPARLAMPGLASVAPGGEAIVQIALERPACALAGDRFVLRDRSGRRTIGGGRVLDPFVASARRKDPNSVAIAEALQLFDPEETLAALLEIPGYEVDTGWFERSFNLESEYARVMYARSNLLLLGKTRTLALPAARVGLLEAELLEVLRAYHRAFPESEGMRAQALRNGFSVKISDETFEALHKQLIERRVIETSGALTRLAGHVPTLSDDDVDAWRKLRPWLEERGAKPFTADDLVGEMRVNHAYANALLGRRCSSGDLWQIVGRRYLLGDQVMALAAAADQLSKSVGSNGFTAAQYRDVLGTGRALAIHILEFFDRIGVTRRRGDLRWINPTYKALVGQRHNV